MTAIMTDTAGNPVSVFDDETSTTIQIADGTGNVIVRTLNGWAVSTAWSDEDEIVAYRPIRSIEAVALLGRTITADQIIQLDTIDLFKLGGVVKVTS